MASRQYRTLYTVGWICALQSESAAAMSMLDEEHDIPRYEIRSEDVNSYILGRIGGHNIVMVCLPAGRLGSTSVASVVTAMNASFLAIRFALLVGIGAGVPSESRDIRLGDMVVGTLQVQHGGVIQLDLGPRERHQYADIPPRILLRAVVSLQAQYELDNLKLTQYIANAFERRPGRPVQHCPSALISHLDVSPSLDKADVP